MTFKATYLHLAVIVGGLLGSGAAAFAETIPLVGFGDSLMAGYQLPQEDALPVRLEKALVADGENVTVVNAGVSGDTTASGLARVDWSVPDGTRGVILELGANDALRGIPPEETEKNLDAIIGRLKDRGIAVLLVGMLAPPNMGADYGERFNSIYPKLAEKHGVPLYPFILDGVVTRSELQLEDGMHPNPRGIAVMVERMTPAVRDFVKTIRDTPK